MWGEVMGIASFEWKRVIKENGKTIDNMYRTL